MARPRLDTQRDALVLSAGARLVQKVMPVEQTTRDRMLLLTINQLIDTGPVDFNAGLVCDQLSIKHPMVKHYFGSKENLLSEAIIWTYRAWAATLIDSIKAAKQTPEAQLRAFVESEIEWGKTLKAMAVLIQYPLVSAKVKAILSVSHQIEMQEFFEYHLKLLTLIIVKLRKKSKASSDIFEQNYTRQELILKHSSAFLAAASISWSTHGVSMWSSGDHLSTTGFSNEIVGDVSRKLAIDSHIKNIISMAKGN